MIEQWKSAHSLRMLTRLSYTLPDFNVKWGRCNLHLIDNLSPLPTAYVNCLKNSQVSSGAKRLRCSPSRRSRSMSSIKGSLGNRKLFPQLWNTASWLKPPSQHPHPQLFAWCNRCWPQTHQSRSCVPLNCNWEHHITRPMLTVKRNRTPSVIASRQSCSRDGLLPRGIASHGRTRSRSSSKHRS